jgi:hypothetical protein
VKSDIDSFVDFLADRLSLFGSDPDFFYRDLVYWFDSLSIPVQTCLVINVAVWILWKISSKQWMINNFTENKENLNQKRVWTYDTHAFSHDSLMHLIANMVCLTSIGPEIAELITAQQFFVIVVTSAISSGALFRIEL